MISLPGATVRPPGHRGQEERPGHDDSSLPSHSSYSQVRKYLTGCWSSENISFHLRRIGPTANVSPSRPLGEIFNKFNLWGNFLLQLTRRVNIFTVTLCDGHGSIFGTLIGIESTGI